MQWQACPWPAGLQERVPCQPVRLRAWGALGSSDGWGSARGDCRHVEIHLSAWGLFWIDCRGLFLHQKPTCNRGKGKLCSPWAGVWRGEAVGCSQGVGDGWLCRAALLDVGTGRGCPSLAAGLGAAAGSGRPPSQLEHPGHEQGCAFCKSCAKPWGNGLGKQRDAPVLPAGDPYLPNPLPSARGARLPRGASDGALFVPRSGPCSRGGWSCARCWRGNGACCTVRPRAGRERAGWERCPVSEKHIFTLVFFCFLFPLLMQAWGRPWESSFPRSDEFGRCSTNADQRLFCTSARKGVDVGCKVFFPFLFWTCKGGESFFCLVFVWVAQGSALTLAQGRQGAPRSRGAAGAGHGVSPCHRGTDVLLAGLEQALAITLRCGFCFQGRRMTTRCWARWSWRSPACWAAAARRDPPSRQNPASPARAAPAAGWARWRWTARTASTRAVPSRIRLRRAWAGSRAWTTTASSPGMGTAGPGGTAASAWPAAGPCPRSGRAAAAPAASGPFRGKAGDPASESIFRNSFQAFTGRWRRKKVGSDVARVRGSAGGTAVRPGTRAAARPGACGAWDAVALFFYSPHTSSQQDWWYLKCSGSFNYFNF